MHHASNTLKCRVPINILDWKFGYLPKIWCCLVVSASTAAVSTVSPLQWLLRAAECCRVLQAAPVPGFTALAKVGAALGCRLLHTPSPVHQHSGFIILHRLRSIVTISNISIIIIHAVSLQWRVDMWAYFLYSAAAGNSSAGAGVVPGFFTMTHDILSNTFWPLLLHIYYLFTME